MRIAIPPEPKHVNADKQPFRIEKDSLGELEVPASALYGIQTVRAIRNFPISGRAPDRDFVLAHVRIKRAAAVANRQAGVLDGRLAEAIGSSPANSWISSSSIASRPGPEPVTT
jgi:aspartate ammonia-lyase